jgi:hypothetical protein
MASVRIIRRHTTLIAGDQLVMNGAEADTFGQGAGIFMPLASRPSLLFRSNDAGLT